MDIEKLIEELEEISTCLLYTSMRNGFALNLKFLKE